MKLHLGCGENYLAGYVNIDFPSDRHSVQTKRVADKYANILNLNYPPNSIKEIRLHHVFEHFQRPIACALLVCWHEWLSPNGLLRIEVPDFVGTAEKAISRFSSEHERDVALRHIFGSQEANWAYHYDGWSERKLRGLLKMYKYHIEQSKKIKYKGMVNIEIYAEKTGDELRVIPARTATESYLTNYLVDRSSGENRLLSVWLKQYDAQIKKSWPKRNR